MKYVYEDGSKAKEDVSETLRFKRFAYVNLVTGHIDYRPWTTTDAVSYTHLDVYKRQIQNKLVMVIFFIFPMVQENLVTILNLMDQLVLV